MTDENLLRSIDGAYLHFNRVDGYKDFPLADHDVFLDMRMSPGKDGVCDLNGQGGTG